MITEAQYENGIEVLANNCAETEQNTASFLEELLLQKNKSAEEIFEFRKFFFDKHDAEKAESYLQFGFFSNQTKDDRIIFFCLALELETLIRKKDFINLCKKYDEDQKLFEEEPVLNQYIRVKGSKKGKPGNELIDYKALKQLGNSEIMQFDKSFMKLSGLNPKISEWLSLIFPHSPLFVRVNPDVISEARLPQLITEELQINPHNINWTSFNFNDTLLKPTQYILNNVAITQETKGEFWDYRIKGIRSLQISTSRKDSYRSFMIEELNDKWVDEEILIGKCIHFDCKNFNDQNLNDQILDHLDLAINVYEKGNRSLRLKENLAKVKITDADYRTHLLRIDNISIKALPVLLLLFFSSITLTEKYISDILK